MAKTIRASVADLKPVTPAATDVFVVDTNVWYWLAYTKASTAAKPYQTTDYPTFIGAAMGVGARLIFLPETLAELAHIIETAEYNLQLAAAGLSPAYYKRKDFRHDATLRAAVVKEIDLALVQVESIGELLPGTRDALAMKAALQELQQHEVDGYDAYILAAARAAGMLEVVTDDGDYATCAGITVLTSNRTTLTEAKAQGKLVVR